MLLGTFKVQIHIAGQNSGSKLLVLHLIPGNIVFVSGMYLACMACIISASAHFTISCLHAINLPQSEKYSLNKQCSSLTAWVCLVTELLDVPKYFALHYKQETKRTTHIQAALHLTILNYSKSVGPNGFNIKTKTMFFWKWQSKFFWLSCIGT